MIVISRDFFPADSIRCPSSAAGAVSLKKSQDIIIILSLLKRFCDLDIYLVSRQNWPRHNWPPITGRTKTGPNKTGPNPKLAHTQNWPKQNWPIPKLAQTQNWPKPKTGPTQNWPSPKTGPKWIRRCTK